MAIHAALAIIVVLINASTQCNYYIAIATRRIKKGLWSRENSNNYSNAGTL